jgi:hypothetical protein
MQIGIHVFLQKWRIWYSHFFARARGQSPLASPFQSSDYRVTEFKRLARNTNARTQHEIRISRDGAPAGCGSGWRTDSRMRGCPNRRRDTRGRSRKMGLLGRLGGTGYNIPAHTNRHTIPIHSHACRIIPRHLVFSRPQDAFCFRHYQRTRRNHPDLPQHRQNYILLCSQPGTRIPTGPRWAD